MPLTRSNRCWSGSLRFLPVILTAILLFSVVTFALSIAHWQDMEKTPGDAYIIRNYTKKRPSSALVDIPSSSLASCILREVKTKKLTRHLSHLFFYSCTVPFISIVHSSVDLLLYLRLNLAPTYALVGSVVMFLVWLVQLTFLMQCEVVGISDIGISKFCPNYGLESEWYDPLGPVLSTFTAFGFLLSVGYIVYLSCAATAVSRAKKERMAGDGLPRKEELGHELNETS